MTEFIDPEQEAKKDTRRAWRFFIVALVLVFGLFAGVMLFYDCPPPDDSSIMPKFTESPGGHNPLAEFLEELEANPLGDLKDLSNAAQSHKDGTEAELKDWLAKQTLPLRAFDELMLTDPSTWRWPGGEAKVSPYNKFGSAVTIMTMARILRMKAQVEASQGEMDAAVKTALQIIKYGRGIDASEATLICYLIAITSSAHGVRSLESALICRNADTTMLAGLQGELTALEPQARDLITSIKIDALYSKNMLKAFKSGKIEAIHSDDPHPGLKKLFLKLNYVQASDMLYTKPVIDGFEVSWEEGWRSSQKASLDYTKFSNDWFKFWITPNAYGNLISKKSMPTCEKLFEKALINVVMSRQAEIMLALRRHELEQGKIPDTLEDLVPKYLAAVPIDPFDGAPLRWNAKTKMIYSVGEDGIDEGGKIDFTLRNSGQTFHSKPDVSMAYWWSAEAKAMREGK
ncbi:hypothetical protein BH11VER1_BH11VER1_37050 [soil metagenome]